MKKEEKCDHASTRSLGFKYSFREGPVSVVLVCEKCGRRIQQNL
jgi:hypothetical protein